MWWHRLGVWTAGIGALAHVGFACLETFGWGYWFVDFAASRWLEGLDRQTAIDHIRWARKLASNVGAYNLALAVGLAWTCWAFQKRPELARPLSIFFAIWLLIAAAAALATQVYGAAVLQGALGVALLVAGMNAPRYGDGQRGVLERGP